MFQIVHNMNFLNKYFKNINCLFVVHFEMEKKNHKFYIRKKVDNV
jgi:hypothetical protein